MSGKDIIKSIISKNYGNYTEFVSEIVTKTKIFTFGK